MEPVLCALPVWADLLRLADIHSGSAVGPGRGKPLAPSGMHNMRRSSLGCGGAGRKCGISVRRELKPDLASVQTRAVQRFEHEEGGEASAQHEGQRAGILGMNSQKERKKGFGISF